MDLNEKVNQSIKLLKVVASTTDEPIELSYSGGKDSDVILRLAQMAGINYRVIYKNTTIDPPGTIKHCRDAGAEIIYPKLTFFDIIEKRGLPNRFARFCCSILKEYKILDNAIQGIRRCESAKRAQRYTEPVICRNYSKKEHANIVLPILSWTNEDVKEFIKCEKIQCHPLYYKNGKFDVTKRLGCLGCPLQTNQVSDFIEYPRLLKLWIKAAEKWFNKEREKELATKSKFNNIYDLFVFYLFFENYSEFQAKYYNTLFKQPSCKQLLEDYFKIDLS